MKSDNSKQKSLKRPFYRKILWISAVILALIVVIPLALGIYIHIATPGPPEQLQAMVEDCEKRQQGCPNFLMKFRAYQQIYLVDAEVAKKFVPPDVELVSFFGLTPGAVFVAEYSYLSYDDPPTPPAGSMGNEPDSIYREVDVLQLAAKGPGGINGAWASHVLVTHPKMAVFARELGLPAQVIPNGIEVQYNCDKSRQGIVFDIGNLKGKNEPERVLGVKACLPHGPGKGFMNLKELENHTLPNLTGRISRDKSHIYGAEPHTIRIEELTDFMLYLFTFWKAAIRLSSPVPQNVEGDGIAARSFAELLKGPRLPFCTVLDGVESTVWDTLERKDGEWKRSKVKFNDGK